MRLHNKITRKWFEATEYTEKAWKEGGRPHLFDHDPTRKRPELFDEFLIRQKASKMTGSSNVDRAVLLYYMSVYVSQNKLNPRRAIMTIRRVLDGLENKS